MGRNLECTATTDDQDAGPVHVEGPWGRLREVGGRCRLGRGDKGNNRWQHLRPFVRCRSRAGKGAGGKLGFLHKSLRFRRVGRHTGERCKRQRQRQGAKVKLEG